MTMRDAKIIEANGAPYGSELRLMKACQADGMISIIDLIIKSIATETDDG